MYMYTMHIVMQNIQFITIHLIHGLYQTKMSPQGCYNSTDE